MTDIDDVLNFFECFLIVVLSLFFFCTPGHPLLLRNSPSRAQKKKVTKKRKGQDPSAKSHCWNFELSTHGIPSLLPELVV
jgi:hypothetical protein